MKLLSTRPFRKAKELIFLMAFSLISVCAFAQYTLTPDDVKFSDGTITDYTNTVEKNIIIPDNFNGVKVTSIGTQAFYDKSLISITIPNTVTTIGARAFCYDHLSNVTIPGSVLSIGEEAFYYNALKSVVFEENSTLKNVWQNAFASNSGLSPITLPTHAGSGFINYGDGKGNSYQPGDQVTDFGTFYYALIPYTLSLSDVKFSDGTITDYTNSIEKNIIIPDNFNGVKVTSIGTQAFYDNSLISIIIPDSVTAIGDRAFSRNYLSNVTIPGSVVTLGEEAFYFNSLKSVVFEENSNIKNVWQNAFGSNHNLVSVTLPAHAGSSFVSYGDGKGNSYQPGDDVTDFSTFYYALIPYTLTLNDVKFSDGTITDFTNSNEKSIIIPDNFNGVKVTSIGVQAFYANSLINVTIPNTVTTIGDRAFSRNYLLNVIIPGSVVTIGEEAFYFNTLKSVVFEENSHIRSVRQNAFASNTGLLPVALPSHAGSSFVEYIDEVGNTYESGDQITNFSHLIYQLFPASDAVNLKFSENVSSKINQFGEPAIFQFTGSKNDLVLINDFISDDDVKMVLYDGFYQPGESFISNKSATYNTTLARNETYYLVITSATNNYSVNFSFTFNLFPRYKIISYSPNKVGNYGKSTLVLEGNGFNEKSKIKLAKAGQDTLQTENLTFNRYKCNALFDFANEAKGKWDIVVDFGDTLITLNEGLEIEEYRAPEITVELIGPINMRINRYTYYTIHYRNTGNTNVYEVPIPISIAGANETQLDLQWDYYRPAGLGDEMPEPVSSVQNPATGEITTITVPTIPMIPPSGEGYLTFGVKVPQLHQNIDIQANSGEPVFYEDPIGNIVANQDFYDCIAGLRDIGVEKLKDWGLDIAAELIPGFECYKSAYDFKNEVDTAMKQSKGNIETPVLGNLSWNLTKTIAECATDFVPVTKAGKLAWKMIKVAMKFEEILEDVNSTVDEINVAKICLNALMGGRNNSLKAKLVASIDPNDKIGYRSPSGSQFFSDQNKFTYIIDFENKSTASAPAQEVFITDTLDVNSFDIASFKAGYIRIGSKIAQAPVNVSENTWEIDMRPAMNLITLVELNPDKTKGIANWYFKCIDPKTNDFPTDALTGFLPPNDTTGRGEGCVSFMIDLKETVKDEDKVKNRASIVFDYNAPILTPTWGNTKDMIAPVSSMSEAVLASDTTATISWLGSDNKGGSGVYCYYVFVKQDSSGYQPLFTRTSKTSAEFKFNKGVEYSFYVTAVDSADNKEVKTQVPDITYFNNSVGIHPVRRINGEMIVYPNPSNSGSVVHVEFIYPEEALRKGRLIVSSVTGKIVRTIAQPDREITISDLKPGAYIFDLIIDDSDVKCETVIVK